MPFVVDREWLDRVPFKKGPGTIHDRVLRIAYEATPPEELRDEPLDIYSRFGEDFAGGSLESVDFMLRLEREFGPFLNDDGSRGSLLLRFCGGGVSPILQGEFERFGSKLIADELLDHYSFRTLGYFILFFEAREQG